MAPFVSREEPLPSPRNRHATARRGSRGNQARVKARFPLVTEKKHPLPTIVGRGCGEGGAA